MDRSGIAKTSVWNQIAPCAAALALLACCAAPAVADSIETSNRLPPASGYSSSSSDSVTYPGTGVTLSNLRLSSPSRQVSPPGEGATIDSFSFDVFTELSLDGLGIGPGLSAGRSPSAIRITTLYDGYTKDPLVPIIQGATEMLALNISGGDLPGGVMIRESPTLASRGTMGIQDDPGGFRVDSFFDVFTELSLDGGITWVPSSGGERSDGSLRIANPAPEPGTLLLLVAGLGVIACARRRRRA